MCVSHCYQWCWRTLPCNPKLPFKQETALRTDFIQPSLGPRSRSAHLLVLSVQFCTSRTDRRELRCVQFGCLQLQPICIVVWCMYMLVGSRRGGVLLRNMHTASFSLHIPLAPFCVLCIGTVRSRTSRYISVGSRRLGHCYGEKRTRAPRVSPPSRSHAPRACLMASHAVMCS